MITVRRLRRALADAWGLADATVEVHNGGMNSATWFVGAGGERWVAKAVDPAARRSFAGGLRSAAAVDAAGIPAGAPVATRQGEIVADVDGVPLALLTWVAGETLGPADLPLIGGTLAAAHRALLGVPVADRFHWVDPRAGHLGLRPWIRGAVAAAVEAYEDLGPETLTWGPLHTDPEPGAFLLDRASGVCGLIDWGIGLTGPLLYDLASAVMYAGGPDRAGPLIDAYLAGGVVPAAEVDRGLGVPLRLRWAVQADYFARRIADGDLTGIASAADNEEGLEDARAGLSHWGP